MLSDIKLDPGERTISIGCPAPVRLFSGCLLSDYRDPQPIRYIIQVSFDENAGWLSLGLFEMSERPGNTPVGISRELITLNRSVLLIE